MIRRNRFIAGASMLLIATASAHGKAPSPAPVSAPPPPTSAEDDGRIIGGVPAKLGEFKYQAELFWKEPAKGGPKWLMAHWCGGALISPDRNAKETRWVLTAGHCVYSSTGYNPKNIGKDLAVRAGFLRLDDAANLPTSYDVDPAGVFPYPGFVIPDAARQPGEPAARVDGKDELRMAYLVEYTNDLALIRLSKPIPIGGNVGVIPLADDAPVVGQYVVVTGWGVADHPEKGLSAMAGVVGHVQGRPVQTEAALQAVPIPVIQCLPDPNSVDPPPTAFCAGAPGKDTCVGDSGGPVVTQSARPVLVGIVSRRTFGQDKCGGPDVQTRYTRLDPAMIAWINATMRAAR